jgi:ElaA protein
LKISAQAHLQKFYEDHNFKRIGEGYLEDGIPHVGMILKR